MKVSIVTVTMKNEAGLKKTINSLLSLEVKPYEIIVVDGCKNDSSTVRLLEVLKSEISVTVIQGEDSGIYDAMNIGHSAAKGDLIHYLNAGDIVKGEPYVDVKGPIIYPVSRIYGDKESPPLAELTLFGYGCCHQSIILPRSHSPYDLTYNISADLDMLMRTFPSSLAEVPRAVDGYIIYDLTGLSSTSRLKRDVEIFRVFISHKNYYNAMLFLGYAGLKFLLPRKIRLWLRGLN